MTTEGRDFFYYISTRGIGFDRAAITSVLWYGASSLDAPSCVVAVAWLKGTARPELRNMPGQLTAHCAELGGANYDAITVRGGQWDRLWVRRRLLESSAIRPQPTPVIKHPTCWVGAVGNQGATLASWRTFGA